MLYLHSQLFLYYWRKEKGEEQRRSGQRRRQVGSISHVQALSALSSVSSHHMARHNYQHLADHTRRSVGIKDNLKMYINERITIVRVYIITLSTIV